MDKKSCFIIAAGILLVLSTIIVSGDELVGCSGTTSVTCKVVGGSNDGKLITFKNPSSYSGGVFNRGAVTFSKNSMTIKPANDFSNEVKAVKTNINVKDPSIDTGNVKFDAHGNVISTDNIDTSTAAAATPKSIPYGSESQTGLTKYEYYTDSKGNLWRYDANTKTGQQLQKDGSYGSGYVYSKGSMEDEDGFKKISADKASTIEGKTIAADEKALQDSIDKVSGKPGDIDKDKIIADLEKDRVASDKEILKLHTDAAKSSLSVDGQKYARSEDGTYSANGGVLSVDNGKVVFEDYQGRKTTLEDDNPVAVAIKENEQAHQALKDYKEGLEGADSNREGGKSRAAGADGKKAPPEKLKAIGWTEMKKQAAAAGGWFNYFTGGPFQGSIMTLGGIAGENFIWGGESAYAEIKNHLTINGWAESACRSNLDINGKRAIITSSSGNTRAHAEGEYVEVDPCFGADYNESCKKYRHYRISGEITAGEAPMKFKVYLSGKSEDWQIYDPETVELKQGETLSLSGANMYVLDTIDEYNEVCIKFEDTTQLKIVFGATFSDDDNPVCREIVEGGKRDYQQFKTQTPSASSKPKATPTKRAGLSV
jgi:hypothetical protein